jgi:hypothetical protein
VPASACTSIHIKDVFQVVDTLCFPARFGQGFRSAGAACGKDGAVRKVKFRREVYVDCFGQFVWFGNGQGRILLAPKVLGHIVDGHGECFPGGAGRAAVYRSGFCLGNLVRVRPAKGNGLGRRLFYRKVGRGFFLNRKVVVLVYLSCGGESG